MNNQLLSSLGINTNLDLKSIQDELETKQFDYLERLENVNDVERKLELTEVLKQIDSEIASVKSQIQAVSSSLILDSDSNTDISDESSEEVKNLEQQVDKKYKTEQVSGKVERMKNKKAEKQVKEAERRKNEAERATQKQQTDANTQSQSGNGGANTNQSISSSAPQVKDVSNNSTEFVNGLVEYKRQNYPAAFSIFKELSENGDASSQYLIALMYMDGLGTNKDLDRAMFWLKKSAESGETAGQYSYGATLLTNNNGDQKRIREGYKHLQAAAEKGDEDAMRKYIDATLSQLGRNKEIAKSMEYCDKLKANDSDSFNREKYDKIKKKIKEIKKSGNKGTSTTRSNSGNLYTYKKKKKFTWWLVVVIIIIIIMVKNYIKKSDAETSYSNDASTYSAVEENKNSNKNYEEDNVKEKIRITADAANIRSGPSTDNGVIDAAKSGDEFVTTGNTEVTTNGRIWYEIYLDNNRESTGWISEKVLEIIK